jgi:hypothetical protein
LHLLIAVSEDRFDLGFLIRRQTKLLGHPLCLVLRIRNLVRLRAGPLGSGCGRGRGARLCLILCQQCTPC